MVVNTEKAFLIGTQLLHDAVSLSVVQQGISCMFTHILSFLDSLPS